MQAVVTTWNAMSEDSARQALAYAERTLREYSGHMDGKVFWVLRTGKRLAEIRVAGELVAAEDVNGKGIVA